MRQINENFTRNFPMITKLELDREYEMVEAYPREGRKVGVTIINYIRYKDLPNDIKQVVDDYRVENNLGEFDLVPDYWVGTEFNPRTPIVVASGSDDKFYVGFRTSESEEEYEFLDIDQNRTLTFKQ